MLISGWIISLLMIPDTGWNTETTVITGVYIFALLLAFFVRHPGLFSKMVESTVDFVLGVIEF
jgi:hypothetical protein